MNKTGLCLLAAVCLWWGCKTAPVQSSAPRQTPEDTQTLPAQPAAAPAQTSPQTLPLSQEEPAQPAAPQKAHAPISAPVSAPAEPAPPAVTAPVPAAVPAPEARTPALPPQDKPAFEDETLIDVKGRLLSPYAYLEADSAKRTGAPWDGEQLKFGIYYAFVKAGNAYIRNRGLTEIDGRPAYLIQTTAFSTGAVDAFFKVRDINQSWIDAETFYSRGYGQSVREGNYKRDEWVNFDPAAGRFYGKIQKKEEPREINGTLASDVTDFLSALYYVRAQKLEIGQDVVFDIVNREKQYPLLVKVLRKESVKTPAGKFDCIVVEPQLRGEGIFVSKGKSLTVWLTDDQYRMPVKMKTEVFIGSVSATLLEYKRL